MKVCKLALYLTVTTGMFAIPSWLRRPSVCTAAVEELGAYLLAEKTVQHFGRLDILVVRALSNPPYRCALTSLERGRRQLPCIRQRPLCQCVQDRLPSLVLTRRPAYPCAVIEIDLQGTFIMCKAAFEPLKRSGSGFILNISAVTDDLIWWQAHAASAKVSDGHSNALSLLSICAGRHQSADQESRRGVGRVWHSRLRHCSVRSCLHINAPENERLSCWPCLRSSDQHAAAPLQTPRA